MPGFDSRKVSFAFQQEVTFDAHLNGENALCKSSESRKSRNKSADTLKSLIGSTGYRMKLASECVEPERLERVNRIDQLESADVLVKLHEEARASRVAAQAIELRGSV